MNKYHDINNALPEGSCKSEEEIAQFATNLFILEETSLNYFDSKNYTNSLKTTLDFKIHGPFSTTYS